MRGINTGTVIGITSSCISRAEEAFCRSVINYNAVRGVFGASIMRSQVLGDTVWKEVSLLRKPQGIDGLYVKRNFLGAPKSLLVAEAKYGTSRLNLTRDGMQMSSTWITPRIRIEAARYISAGTSTNVRIVPGQQGHFNRAKDSIDITLSNGKVYKFWREDGLWSFNGPAKSLGKAQQIAKRDGEFFLANAEGKIKYRKQIIHTSSNTETITTTTDSGRVVKIKLDSSKLISSTDAGKKEIIEQLKKKYPYLSNQEAESITEEATRGKYGRDFLNIKKQSYFKTTLKTAGNAAIIGAVIAGGTELISQYLYKGRINLKRVYSASIMGGVSAGASVVAHYGIVYAAIRIRAMQVFIARTSSVIGLPSGAFASRLLGTTAGAIAGNIVFAGGMLLTGNISDKEAMRTVVSGLVGTAAGGVAVSGTMALVGMYATAGTGTAISTLSGAAATNASLAWLGGGSALGGMSGGAMVLSGGAAFVIIVVGIGVSKMYYVFDDKQDCCRHQLNAKSLLDSPGVLEELCRRRFLGSVITS